MKKIIVIAVVVMGVMLSGCSTFNSESFSADGAKASAFCTTGGPGGVLGIGPGGIVAGAKVNQDFKGSVKASRDCSLEITSE